MESAVPPRAGKAEDVYVSADWPIGPHDVLGVQNTWLPGYLGHGFPEGTFRQFRTDRAEPGIL
jgi:hypothetical protein